MDTGPGAYLTSLGIGERHIGVISLEAGGEKGFLEDIDAEDLLGKLDATGVSISAPVSRGLVRMLRNGI
eukprot:13432323-Alexandrium_andersonii.AAC.1